MGDNFLTDPKIYLGFIGGAGLRGLCLSTPPPPNGGEMAMLGGSVILPKHLFTPLTKVFF